MACRPSKGQDRWVGYPSIDYGQSRLFESHVILFEKNNPAFENVTRLEQLPEKGFTIVALPMKIKGGELGVP